MSAEPTIILAARARRSLSGARRCQGRARRCRRGSRPRPPRGRPTGKNSVTIHVGIPPASRCWRAYRSVRTALQTPGDRHTPAGQKTPVRHLDLPRSCTSFGRTSAGRLEGIAFSHDRRPRRLPRRPPCGGARRLRRAARRLQERRRDRLARALRAERGGVRRGGARVRPARAGGRGRGQGASAPKLERYGDTLFLVLRPARYVDETETVVFGEVEIFVGPQFVITVRHGDAPELGPVRRRLEARPDLLRARADGDRVRDRRPRRRRLRAGRRRPGERHRRDRGRGLRRQPDRLPSHLRADPRGDRVPARDRPARRRSSRG